MEKPAATLLCVRTPTDWAKRPPGQKVSIGHQNRHCDGWKLECLAEHDGDCEWEIEGKRVTKQELERAGKIEEVWGGRTPPE